MKKSNKLANETVAPAVEQPKYTQAQLVVAKAEAWDAERQLDVAKMKLEQKIQVVIAIQNYLNEQGHRSPTGQAQ